MFRHLQSVLWQDSARKGVAASLTLHAGAALLLASGWLAALDHSPQFSGSRQAIKLEASVAEVLETEVAVELPSVQIQPGVARIAEQLFVDRPAVATDWELPQVLSAAERALPAEISRASNVDASTEMELQTHEQIPRTDSTPAPRVPLAIPEPAGLETKPPTFFDNPPPRYPELAKQRRWEGDVLLRMVIDRAGQVAAVTVERSSGYKMLDAAAVNAVRRWRATPATQFGRPVETIEYLRVQFRL